MCTSFDSLMTTTRSHVMRMTTRSMVFSDQRLSRLNKSAPAIFEIQNENNFIFGSGGDPVLSSLVRS